MSDIKSRKSIIKKMMKGEKGEIKEQGSHSELMKQNGYYRNLHDMQFSELGDKK